MNEFLHHLNENDRVLLVGDVRQHQAVEAEGHISSYRKPGSRRHASMKSCGKRTRRSKK